VPLIWHGRVADYTGANVDDVASGYRLSADCHLAHLLSLPQKQYLRYNGKSRVWEEARMDKVLQVQTSHRLIYRLAELELSGCKDLEVLIAGLHEEIDDTEYEDTGSESDSYTIPESTSSTPGYFDTSDSE